MGSRKEEVCIDMIFATRQLLEKCREHDDVLFVLFTDLKKAYGTVPRDALWVCSGNAVFHQQCQVSSGPSMMVCWLKSEWGETVLPTAVR